MARRLYTPELANRSLPLVRAIARSVRETALEMERVWGDLERAEEDGLERSSLSRRAQDVRTRFAGLLDELDGLGVELKNPFTGLLDFRARRGESEVFLCWQLGEESVGHWHELEAGFHGRQPIASL